MMKRLPVSFVFASLCHLAAFTIPLGYLSVPPKLVSDRSITVTLASSPAETPLESTDAEPVEKQVMPVVFPQAEPVLENEVIPEKKETLSETAVKRLVPKRFKKKIPRPVVPGHTEPISRTEPVPARPQQAATAHASPAAPAARPKDSVVEAAPLYRHNPKPPYPSLARKRKWQGTVMLRIMVSEQGATLSCSIDRSSGYEILDHSALRAVRTWRFLPGTINGRAHPMEILVPVRFVLK